jgi:hypothetical protein
MFQFPGSIRATVGLIATAADNVRKSPEKLIEIPMLAVSTALQASIRTQQRYAQFTVRGDEILGRMRPVPDTAPTWATFDDEIALPAKQQTAPRATAPNAPPIRQRVRRPSRIRHGKTRN